eukprot:scaffold31284_cov108-Isochrysis_galbana.AAC.2
MPFERARQGWEGASRAKPWWNDGIHGVLVHTRRTHTRQGTGVGGWCERGLRTRRLGARRGLRSGVSGKQASPSKGLQESEVEWHHFLHPVLHTRRQTLISQRRIRSRRRAHALALRRAGPRLYGRRAACIYKWTALAAWRLQGVASAPLCGLVGTREPLFRTLHAGGRTTAGPAVPQQVRGRNQLQLRPTDAAHHRHHTAASVRRAHVARQSREAGVVKCGQRRRRWARVHRPKDVQPQHAGGAGNEPLGDGDVAAHHLAVDGTQDVAGANGSASGPKAPGLKAWRPRPSGSSSECGNGSVISRSRNGTPDVQNDEDAVCGIGAADPRAPPLSCRKHRTAKQPPLRGAPQPMLSLRGSYLRTCEMTCAGANGRRRSGG